MIHYYSITCPRGYENEITVQAFTARAERDDHVARYDANPNGRSYPATRSEAEARLAINRQARALHRADGRYPECSGTMGTLAEIQAVAWLRNAAAVTKTAALGERRRDGP